MTDGQPQAGSSRKKRLILFGGLLIVGVVVVLLTRSTFDIDETLDAQNRENLKLRKQALYDSEEYDETGFTRSPTPKEGEYLHSWPIESGQDYQDYLLKKPRRRTAEERIIIVEVGEVDERATSDLESLREYVEIYFHTKTVIGEGRPLSKTALTEDGKQYDAQLVINELHRSRPKNTAVIVGICTDDITAKGRNFLFGLGSYKDSACIVSTHRYEYEEDPTPTRTAFRRRLFRMVTHETGHNFGLHHCIYFGCTMNGMSSQEELDSQPLHLCPVCLRKLTWNLGLDLPERYRALEEIYRKNDLEGEADWVEKQRAYLEKAGKTILWTADDS